MSRNKKKKQIFWKWVYFRKQTNKRKQVYQDKIWKLISEMLKCNINYKNFWIINIQILHILILYVTIFHADTIWITGPHSSA